MPLIDPNYLRQAAMGRVNQGLLPAVNDEDYAAMLERLRQDYGLGPTDSADGGEVGNILDTQPTADVSGLVGQDSLDQGAADRLNVGMLPAVGRRAADDMTASPAAGMEPVPIPEMTDQEHWAEALRLGIIPKGDPAVGAKATAEDYPSWMQGPLKAAMLPAVGVSRIVGGTPDALAAAFTAPKRAYTGELQVTQADPVTGETHATPQAVGEGMNIAMTAPLGAVAAAPIKGAVGMGVRTKLPISEPAPAFYSRLREVTDAAPFPKAPGKSWAGYVKNAQGVKSDELDWTGFSKWAEDQKGMVTKEEVQKYLDENALKVDEVIKGGQDVPATAKLPENWEVRAREHFDDGEGNIPDYATENFYVLDGRTDIVGAGPTEEAAIIDAQPAILNKPLPSNATKFDKYQLPGGENYREMLLTLPSKLDETARRDLLSGRREAKHFPNDFVSGHYDEPNVLAHMRFNDRVDANSKKTLFIEENQSDWHQRGRKQGYRGDTPTQDLPQGVKIYPPNDENPYTRSAYALELPQSVRGRSLFYGSTQEEAEASARDFIANRGEASTAVPDAPFKKDWHELALKRAIKYAADHGYDQIAWTPGAVQAERYDLSKQVKEVAARKNADGTYNLAVEDINGNELFGGSGKQVTAEEMADHVGKDLAEKLIKGADAREGRPWPHGKGQTNNPQFEVLRGVDLKVGGEGMIGFYDQMHPAAANKIGKKYGAKVGTTRLKPRGDEVRDERFPLAYDTAVGKKDVWVLPITPALKEQAVKKGFPVSALEDLTRAVG